MKSSAEFEAALERLAELDDPLCVYDQYYSYLSATEADALTVTRLLERATQTFVEDRRYRNDPRYLRLWLAYALRCRDPEDIFAFLGMHGIAADLAGYYEAYGEYLERRGDIDKAWGVIKLGVDRQAQPLERLARRLSDFVAAHPNQLGTKRRKSELVTHRAEMLRPAEGQPELSFEEVRARSWRRAGSILRTAYQPIPHEAPLDSNVLASDELEAEAAAALGPLDPDDLTHISVYKDNTADLRELARALHPAPPRTDENRASLANNNTDEGAPLASLPKGPLKATSEIAFDEFLRQEEPLLARSARLSLIPEESDGHTQVTGHLRSLLRGQQRASAATSDETAREIFTVTDADLRAQQTLDPTADAIPRLVVSSDVVAPRLAAMEKSIGRDGVGQNHTVASLRIASGHYFIERRLGTSIFLAIDLDADVASTDLHQIALKVSPTLWEAFVLGRRTEGIRGIPKLGKVCKHPDGIILTESFCPHGSLASLLLATGGGGGTGIDEKLLLFWLRDAIRLVSQLHRQGIIHGQISLEHLLVRLGPTPLSLTFDPSGGGGWADRGVTLVDFSKAVDRQRLGAPPTAEIYLEGSSTAALSCGGHQRLATLDVRGLLALLEQLVAGRVSPLRLADTWKGIRSWLDEALASPADRLGDIYEQMLLMMDERLKLESATLPTLKSLLTRLEISLLERPPAATAG